MCWPWGVSAPPGTLSNGTYATSEKAKCYQLLTCTIARAEAQVISNPGVEGSFGRRRLLQMDARVDLYK